jgi:type II secretion system protein G
MKKLINKKGFTLIELMIVIVILGILMGTILPRLSGAQGRARDTGRIADLTTISQAMELYFDDFKRYPGDVTSTNPVCLKPSPSPGANFDFEDVFKTYFKGDAIPTPPRDAESVAFGGASCTGGYLYLPLRKRSTDTEPKAYAIVANVEVGTKGNAINSSATGLSLSTTPAITEFNSYNGTQTFEDVVDHISSVTPEHLAEADGNVQDGSATVYVLAN